VMARDLIANMTNLQRVFVNGNPLVCLPERAWHNNPGLPLCPYYSEVRNTITARARNLVYVTDEVYILVDADCISSKGQGCCNMQHGCL
jgi:hypothetical protein